MKKLLVFDKGTLTTAQREQLGKELPELKIQFVSDTPKPEELGQVHFIFGNPPPAVLKHCHQLELLQLMSAGFEGYPQALPEQATLVSASGGYGVAISEHMLAMLLFLQKKIHLYHQNQLDCNWQDEGPVGSIDGSHALILGAGDIGSEFASRLSKLGGHTVGLRRNIPADSSPFNQVVTMDQLDKFLPQCDILALCLPDTEQTRNIINANRLALLSPNTILLNVGRGTAVDTLALNQALRDGKLGGAGLDVTDPEPLPPEHPLWKAPNLIITPHVSGGNHMKQTFEKITNMAIHTIRTVMNGELPERTIQAPGKPYRP